MNPEGHILQEFFQCYEKKRGDYSRRATISQTNHVDLVWILGQKHHLQRIFWAQPGKPEYSQGIR